MVNDQLMRIHQLRLLSYEKMNSHATGTKDDELVPASPLPSSSLLRQEHKLSSSAPASSSSSSPQFMSKNHKSEEDNDRVAKKKLKYHIEENLSKSQNSSPTRVKYPVPLKTQLNNISSPLSKNHRHHHITTNKRRSSWRNLLSPSYKSRSDEFHKLFCDKIPRNERLIADYACALHRDILIQGRIYISINYIAFYSNLFSWITKLVVRLRDVTEVYKANTYKVVPNAIQFITKTGEKHVFASFVARDKSYVMILRIWHNNLLKERMTDEEIRSLVHLSYGKDLGMSDSEELNINSPDPRTPANVPPADSNEDEDVDDDATAATTTDERRVSNELDGNNNPGSVSKRLRGSSETMSPKDDSAHEEERDDLQVLQVHSHARYNSLDYSNNGADKQNEVMNNLSKRLTDLSDSYQDAEPTNHEDAERMSLAATISPTVSSAVVVDTPDITSDSTRRLNITQETDINYDDIGDEHPSNCDEHQSNEDNQEQDQQHCTSVSVPAETGEQANNTNSSPDGVTMMATLNIVARSLETQSSSETQVPDDYNHKSEVELETTTAQQTMPDEGGATHSTNDQEMESDLCCGCDQHQGQMIVNQVFDIDVDTLFSLIFTNSKFMRAYMTRRGVTESNISNWRRTSPGSGGANSGADKSNSSTLSNESRHSLCSNLKPPRNLNSKQSRQLKYSMNINHMWAKQVQIEERQNICHVKPGVYVLKSQSINSGIPYGETFTVDLTYCLTRQSDHDKSRMLVHGWVNFNKDKQNWKLAMVKSLIEKQSIQGVNDFISDLTKCIKEHIISKKRRKNTGGNREQQVDGDKAIKTDQEQSIGRQGATTTTTTAAAATTTTTGDGIGGKRGALAANGAASNLSELDRCKLNNIGNIKSGGSLARAKSKLKERKLRNMYKYYIYDEQQHQRRANDSDSTDCGGQGDGGGGSSSSGNSSSSGASFLDDNSSMMMMMAAAREETDSRIGHLVSGRLGNSGRSFSDLNLEDDEDEEEVDDDDDDDHLAHDHPRRHNGDISHSSGRGGHYGFCHRCQTRTKMSRMPRSRRQAACSNCRANDTVNIDEETNSSSSSSTTNTSASSAYSNMTLNNLAATKKRDLEAGRDFEQDEKRRRCSKSREHSTQTRSRSREAHRQRGRGGRSACCSTGVKQQHLESKIKKHQRPRTSIYGSFVNGITRNGGGGGETLIGFMILAMVPILVAMLISQIIIIRRLDAIEASFNQLDCKNLLQKLALTRQNTNN